MVCKSPWDMHLLLLRKTDLKTLFLLLEAFAYATATNTKGMPGNQWNPGQSFPQQTFPQTKGAPLGGWDDEVSNPQQGRFPGQGSMWKLEDSIPGVPGQSYPNFRKLPDTSFDCRNQIGPGYYADLESKCQVFHICQADGRQNSFLCPLGTIFNQQSFTCDWWFNVICNEATMHYTRNENLYKSPFIGIDGMKVSSYGGQRRPHKTRNVRQPPVGIPNAHPNSNWNQEDPSQKNWRGSQRGSQKGDNKPINQSGMRRQQNWQNKGSSNANAGQRNFVKGQSGSRRNNNGQQRGYPSQKGWNPQGSIGGINQDWNQSGGRIPNSQIFNQQRNINERRQPNVRDQLNGQNKRHPNLRGMGRNRNVNSNKGFDTNTWSIRSQNFQVRSQDRKGSGSEVWPNNDSEDGFDREVHEPHKDTGPDNNSGFSNVVNEEHFENKDQYNEWNYSAENANQWEENIQENDQAEWSDSYNNDYDYS